MRHFLWIFTWVMVSASPGYAQEAPEASDAPESVVKTKSQYTHHFSFGFLDHRTGSSIVSYSRTLWAGESQEIFAGVGSALALNTAALGWKFYAFEYYVDVYLVVAVHAMAGMSDNIIVAPFFSGGVEKEIWEGYFLNAGVNNTVRLYIEDSKFYRDAELVVFPHGSLSYRW